MHKVWLHRDLIRKENAEWKPLALYYPNGIKSDHSSFLNPTQHCLSREGIKGFMK